MLYGIPLELIVFVGSMIPLLESRIIIPLGITHGLNPFVAITLGVLGNFIIIPPLLHWMPQILDFFKRIHPLFKKIIGYLFKKYHIKHSKKFNAYGAIALISFVAIPIPGTGAITGSLLAYMFNLDYKKSLLNIFIGICLSAMIMTAIVTGVVKILQ